MAGKSKPKKMSISEFMAGTPTREIDMLPTAPKQRGPDDDGSFRRNNHNRDRDRGGRDRYNNDRYNNDNRRNSDTDDQHGSWRNSNRSGDSFRERDNRDNSMGGSNRDRDDMMENNGPQPSRADGDTSWRRGERNQLPPPPASRSSDRYSRSDSDSRYNRQDSSDRWARSTPVEQPRERPKLQLSKRSIPIEKKNETNSSTKSNIFGGAKAVDTASRLAELQLKEKKDENMEEKSFPMNSRAAAFEASARQQEPSSQSSGKYRASGRTSATNRRFSDLGNEEEDRGYHRQRDSQRYSRSEDQRDSQRFSRSDDQRDSQRFSRSDDQRDSQRFSRSDDRHNNDHQSRYSSNRYQHSSYSNRDDQQQRYNSSDNYRRQHQQQDDKLSTPPSSQIKNDKVEPREAVKEESFPPLVSTISSPPTVTTKSSNSQKQSHEQQEKKEETEQQDRQKEEEKQKKQNEEEEKELEKLTLERAQKEESAKLLKSFHETCGEDLVSFINDNSNKLPDLETLLFSLLECYEKEDISWVLKEKHGLGLKSLVKEDDSTSQLQLLWAVQKYCDSINFPKNTTVKDNETWHIHTLFRVLFENELVSYDTFFVWKDDETISKDAGKTKAIIQTMDWFTWLEELLGADDEDSDEYENEEEEDEYPAY